jgi:subtilase family serine protease
LSGSRWSRRGRGVVVALGVAALTLVGTVAAQAAPAATPGTTTATPGAAASPNAVASLRAEVQHGTLLQTHGVANVCATKVKLACLAKVVTISPGSTRALSTTTPAGYGAPDLEKAYNLSGGQSGTIAILDAGAYPSLESDLATYRAQYGLPACTTASGCLTIADYKGGPPLQPSTNGIDPLIEEQVAVETALDVDMASAACPACKIIELQLPDEDALVQGSNADQQTTDFGTAVNTAASLGANSVSMSYQYPTDQFEETSTPGLDLFHPGMAVLASSGDSGYEGNVSTGWPANLPWVTQVGGTSLYQGQNGSFSQVAWAGAGSGCETSLPPAIGQPASVGNYCGGHRAGSDISAVADPNTGVGPTPLYTAGKGWDGPTGLGTPKGLIGF